MTGGSFIAPTGWIHSKDWYIVQIIGIIVGIQHDDFDVIFPGGTVQEMAYIKVVVAANC